jgi:hypothetical protein
MNGGSYDAWERLYAVSMTHPLLDLDGEQKVLVVYILIPKAGERSLAARFIVVNTYFMV